MIKKCEVCGTEITGTLRKRYCSTKCCTVVRENHRLEKMRLEDVKRNVEVWTLDMKTWIWISSYGRVDLPDYLLGKEDSLKVKDYVAILKSHQTSPNKGKEFNI